MMIIKENKKIELDIFTLNLYDKKNSEKNMHQFQIIIIMFIMKIYINKYLFIFFLRLSNNFGWIHLKKY